MAHREAARPQADPWPASQRSRLCGKIAGAPSEWEKAKSFWLEVRRSPVSVLTTSRRPVTARSRTATDISFRRCADDAATCSRHWKDTESFARSGLAQPPVCADKVVTAGPV